MSLSQTILRLTAKALLAAGPALLLSAEASAETYNMPQFGRHEKQVTETIDFYDLRGTGSISGSSSNSFATVVFTPAAPGEAVQITFSRIHLKGDGANYPVSLSIFDGSYNEEVTYPETTSGVTPTDFPTTDKMLDRFAAFDKSEIVRENLTYTSSEPDGALSVCFLYKYADTSEGWTATVNSVKLVDQELKTVTADYTVTPSVTYPGLKDVTLGTLNVATEGILNPFKVTSLGIELTDEASVLENIRLYHGSTLIETQPEQNGNLLTYTLDRTLSSGDNKLTVKADIKADAPFYSSAAMRFSTITTTATATPAIDGQGEAQVNVAALVLMPTGDSHQSFDVQQGKEVLFYDSGGPDGKYLEKQNGTVTFRPAAGAEGKVMIDFSMLQLFNTSSIGLNDVFVIYDGEEVNPDKILVTLLNETKYRARSTSPDGALTVAFTTKTGIPKDGWNSVVSLFTPQPMSLRGTDISAASTDKLAAGDTDCPLLKLDIVTENTEPAMTCSAFSLDFAGTEAQWEKVKVYSTGNTDSFSADRATLLGEADVTTGALTLTLPEAVTLVEGDNYFWVMADVAPAAANGSKVDATVTSVTLNGEAVATTPASTETGREVYNVVYPSTDHPVKTVYGSMFVANRPYSSSYQGYDGTRDDLLVTFLPSSEGSVCEVDFTKLYLYFYESQWYPSSNVTPVFKIFAGQDTDGQLLYELTKSDNDTFQDNPAAFGVVRSTAADGSLTILFNAGASGSSTCKDSRFGFLGEVREYRSRPMTVSSAFADGSPMTSVAVTKAQNVPMLRVAVSTEGNLNPLSLDNITFTLKADSSVYEKVRLASSGNRADAAMATEILTGEIGEDGTVSFTPQNFLLAEGENNLWLMADIKAGAAPGSVIDAKVDLLKIAGNVVEVSDPDPEGEILTVNTYDPILGNSDQEVFVGEYPVLVNGVTAEYMTNNYTITARPALDNGKIIATFTEGSFNVNTSNQYITVLGGEGPVGIDHDTVYPVTVTSTREDGSLTIEYHSMTIGIEEGWKCLLSCDARQPLTISEITALPSGSGEATRGSETLLYGIGLTVTGDKNPITLTSVEFDIPNSADIFSSLSLYATGTTNEFTDDNMVASTDGTSSQLVLDEPIVISEATSEHLWLVGAVKQEATVGAETTITPRSLNYSVNGETASASLTELAPTTLKVVAGFSGEYRIGSSAEADFADFATAIRAMAAGIEGPVVFNIESGTYSERVELDHIQGVSETNTIAFRGVTDDPADVNIVWNNWSEPPYSDDKLDFYYGVFTLRGTSHVSLSGLTIKTTNVQMPAVLQIAGASSDISLDRCVLTAPVSGTNYNNLALINCYVSSSAPKATDRLSLTDCEFNGGYCAVKFGAASINQPEAEGLTVEGCTFSSQGYQALYLPMARDITVKGNLFTGIDGNADKNYCQMIDMNVSGPVLVEGNVLRYSKPGAYGMYLRRLEGSQENPVVIANNILDITSGSYPGAAIQLYNSRQWPFTGFTIAHNTVRTYGNDVIFPLLINVREGTTVDGLIANNVLQNEADCYVIKEQYGPSGAKYIANVGHTDNPVHAYWGGSYDREMTFNQWVLASNEEDARNDKVIFNDEDETKPLYPGNPEVLKNGTPVEAVTTDFLGNLRSTTAPTIGAYEIDESGIDLLPADASTELPVNGTLTAESTLTVDGTDTEARIHSLSGALVLLRKVNGPTTLDLSGLPRGLYLLSVGNRTCKLMLR